MKKLVLILCLAAGFNLAAKAQNLEDMAHLDNGKAAFSIGPELAIPAHSVYSIGYGASLKIEVAVAERFNVTVTGGLSNLHYKSGLVGSFGGPANSSFIPLKAGVRYALGTGFFFEGELGDVIETKENTLGNKRNLFAFSFGPVFLVKLSEKQNVDIGVRYESWSQNTLQQTAIRVAYRLGW